VDAGHHLDEISIKALELADQVILVANQSVPALSNARKLLEILELLGLGDLDLEIWMNSWEKHGDLSLEESLQSFERGVALTGLCQRALSDAEQRVEILTGKGADAKLEPLDGGD